MTLEHEKLDVYRFAIDDGAWVYEKGKALAGAHRPAQDQWRRC